MIASIVVAASRNDVIGHAGDLPWHLPGDLKRFRRLTAGHPVVMGRRTYQSILTRLGHPLPERTSVVVSSSREQAGNEPTVVWASSVESAIGIARQIESAATASEFFVIGGACVYRQALPYMDRIYLTRVHSSVEGDSCLPPGWLQDFCLSSQSDQLEEAEYSYSFHVYTRKVL